MEFLKTIARSILKDEIETDKLTISNLNKTIDEMNNEIKNLNDVITNFNYQSEDEKYYENKYPKANITYKRSDKTGDFYIDVRTFIQPNDFMLPVITGANDDEIALNSLKWVMDNIKYTPDKTIIGLDEYWMYPHETYTLKRSDCEDGSVLLASIMIKNGIKPWKIRVTAGNVVGGGHCFVVYYCEEAKKWVLCDWCYDPNRKPMKDRPDYKDENKYLDIWFSFNNVSAWGRTADIRKADGLLNK